jgi:hypothetical protein
MAKEIKGKSGTTYIIEGGGGRRGKSMSMRDVEYVPFGRREPDAGWKIDGNKVRFWATKALAKAGARDIGWPMGSVTKVHTRFQIGWALSDGRFGLLSKQSYNDLYRNRNKSGMED